jgi:hypothetical protein
MSALLLCATHAVDLENTFIEPPELSKMLDMDPYLKPFAARYVRRCALLFDSAV